MVDRDVPERGPWVAVVVIWVIATAILEAAAALVDPLPPGYSREAEISDEAFRYLIAVGIPVFTGVLAVVAVAVTRFAARDDGDTDGAPLRTDRRVVRAWIVVTTLLALSLVVFPGLIGLAQIEGADESDLVVEVEGAQWFWTVRYPEAGVTSNGELVLPARSRIRFEVTSKDVLHSFWVPAFRSKMDAVPGRTTVILVSTEQPGTSEDEEGLRLQCAEMCGVGHATMRIPVRVLEAGAFETWIDEEAAAAAEAATDEPACAPEGSELGIAADGLAFDRHCLAVTAGEDFGITFDNEEAVPHNVAIYADEKGSDPLFVGEVFSGPRARRYEVGALDAGAYFFRCDLHPIPAMSGTFVVGEG